MKRLILGAFALAAAGVVADVEWKWDASQHVDAAPTATAHVALAATDVEWWTADGELQGYEGNLFSSYPCAWKDSSFCLTTFPLGLLMIVR